jgi:hypothetical protein
MWSDFSRHKVIAAPVLGRCRGSLDGAGQRHRLAAHTRISDPNASADARGTQVPNGYLEASHAAAEALRRAVYVEATHEARIGITHYVVL